MLPHFFLLEWGCQNFYDEWGNLTTLWIICCEFNFWYSTALKKGTKAFLMIISPQNSCGINIVWHFKPHFFCVYANSSSYVNNFQATLSIMRMSWVISPKVTDKSKYLWQIRTSFGVLMRLSVFFSKFQPYVIILSCSWASSRMKKESEALEIFHFPPWKKNHFFLGNAISILFCCKNIQVENHGLAILTEWENQREWAEQTFKFSTLLMTPPWPRLLLGYSWEFQIHNERKRLTLVKGIF